MESENRNIPTSDLSAEIKLQINSYVGELVKHWLIFLGIANLTVLIGALVYIFFILPDKAISTVFTQIEAKNDTKMQSIEAKIDTKMQSLDSKILQASFDHGKTQSKLDSLKNDSETLEQAMFQKKQEINELTEKMKPIDSAVKIIQQASQQEKIEAIAKMIETLNDSKNTKELLATLELKVSMDSFITVIDKIERRLAFLEKSLLHSSFNSGHQEEWTVKPNSRMLTYEPTGGNSEGSHDGYIKSCDDANDGDVTYFVAPPKFHGDWQAFRELSLSLYSKMNNKDGTYGGGSDIKIMNEGMSAEYSFPKIPGERWETFHVSLEDNNQWKFQGGAVTLQDILKNVTGVEIRAEYVHLQDCGGLDDVILITNSLHEHQ